MEDDLTTPPMTLAADLHLSCGSSLAEVERSLVTSIERARRVTAQANVPDRLMVNGPHYAAALTDAAPGGLRAGRIRSRRGASRRCKTLQNGGEAWPHIYRTARGGWQKVLG